MLNSPNTPLLPLPAAQPPQDIVELLERGVADVHGAAGIAVVDADAEAEDIADLALERERVGILLRAAGARLLWFRRHAFLMCELLGLAHAQAFTDDALCQR